MMKYKKGISQIISTILIILLVLAAIVSLWQIVGVITEPEQNQTNDIIMSGDIVATNLTDLNYEIYIDCKWFSEHLNDTTVWFPNQTIELCQYVFPDLFELNHNQGR